MGATVYVRCGPFLIGMYAVGYVVVSLKAFVVFDVSDVYGRMYGHSELVDDIEDDERGVIVDAIPVGECGNHVYVSENGNDCDSDVIQGTGDMEHDVRGTMVFPVGRVYDHVGK